MKNLVLILLFVFPGLYLNAQTPAPCSGPLNSARFNQQLENIRSLQNETRKLQKARETALEYCLSSAQVREMAEVFANDYNRLDFVQTAFPNITDKENHYEIYDAFAYFSNVMRLHDFILSFHQAPVITPPPPPVVTIPFLPLNYPDYQSYMGPSGCHPPLSEPDFMMLAGEVFNQPTEGGRLLKANQLVGQNCLSTAQVMKIAGLLAQENNRLTLAKNAYAHTFDIANYLSFRQLLSHLPYRKELEQFINANQIPPQPQQPPCMVTRDEFGEVMASIKKQNFNNTRLTLAKQILSSRKCFTTQQIKDIVKLFDFEDSKLEIAKYAYDFCIDKQKYFTINDVFTYSSSVEELSKYIQSKH